MSASTTRISDLPENIKMQTSMDGQNTPYSAMNIHPNPYGNSLEPNVIPLPQESDKQSIAPQLTQEQMQMINQQQQSFPSRDIPMDETIYQNDPSIKPNYIPEVDNKHDYIEEYGNFSKEHFANYEKEKHREDVVDMIFSELQLPLFVGTLFFIFQMPLMNSFFSKYFSFLSIYHSDGHLNLYGMIFKSVLFTSVFFSLNKTISYLSVI